MDDDSQPLQASVDELLEQVGLEELKSDRFDHQRPGSIPRREIPNPSPEGELSHAGQPKHRGQFRKGTAWKGNPNGRPEHALKHELINTKTKEVIPQEDYQIRWLNNISKRYKTAAGKALPELLDIARTRKNDTARVMAIKEINSRAMGRAETRVHLRGKISHEHGPSQGYLGLLEEMNRKLVEKQRLLESKTTDAEFEVITEEKKDE